MSLGPVMLDVEGLTLTDEDRMLLRHPLVGGVIYFARNFESADQIAQLSADIRRERPEILIAVDQEGGRVQRFKQGFTRLPAMQKFLPAYQKDSLAALRLVKNCGWLMATELLSVGVDFSFAPVLDTDDHGCEVIADRAFSPDPKEVALLAGAFMEGMAEAGMATTGKHFPGHGSVVGDSHQVLPQDDRTFTTIAAHDLIPFKALSHKLQAIMPAHIVFSEVDSKPVGFSSHWLQNILRQQLGFEGVIFSDDLSMEGAAFAGGYGERALAALGAGCNMALVCNNRQGVLEVIECLSKSSEWKAESSPLSSMSAQKDWSRKALSNDERCTRTQTQLVALIESNNESS
jgi:beta-N-acetylhexosaminidase